MDLYPLKEKHSGMIRSKSGKHSDDICIEAIMKGTITEDDIKISREVLILQAEVALQSGRTQLAGNFVRAAELIDIPDEQILAIYNMLRPYRSTRSELENLIKVMRHDYQAAVCADFIGETLEVYIKRDLLKLE